MEKPATILLGLGRTVGEAIAQRFLSEGHSVLAVDPDQPLLDELNKTTGGKVEQLHSNVHTKLGLKNALSAAREAFGRVDHVVAVPQLPDQDHALTLDMEDFDDSVSRTIRAALETLRVFTDAMLEHREDPGSSVERARQVGSFTFVLSLAAQLAQEGHFSESVTQQSIYAIVKAASVELAPKGIRVNAVIALRPRSEDQESWLKSRTPAGRAAIAEEIAEAAVFLSAPSVAIMTGQAIVLDGGRQRLSGLVLKKNDEDET
jgi:NAD(P)-dependent dehydrogenase (short-subunit alcohol dehydrogenase family)